MYFPLGWNIGFILNPTHSGWERRKHAASHLYARASNCEMRGKSHQQAPSLAAPAGLVWKLQTELRRLQVGLLPWSCLHGYGKVGRKNNQVWESVWSPASWSSTWQKKRNEKNEKRRWYFSTTQNSALFILFRRNVVVRIGKGTNLLNDVHVIFVFLQTEWNNSFCNTCMLI